LTESEEEQAGAPGGFLAGETCGPTAFQPEPFLTGARTSSITQAVAAKRGFSGYGLYLLESAAFALYLSLVFETPRLTILDHAFRFHPLLVLLLWTGAFILFSGLGRIVARREARAFGADRAERFRRGAHVALPFLSMFLSPLVPRYYITRHDLQIRLFLLAAFAILAIAYLKLADLRRLLSGRSNIFQKWKVRFQQLSLGKKSFILFLVAFLVYNACAFALASQGVTFSGDEPYYLLTAHSILYDRDINLANNYANKDYFHFYSREDTPRLNLGIYGQYGKKGENYIYPINLPGVSVLILPWYALSQLLKGKWLVFVLKGSLSVWAALLGVQIYLLVREKWRRETLAFILWLATSFSAPILFYTIHLYPEIPIALFSVYIFRKVSGPGTLSNVHLVFLGLLLGAFPWFGLKYHFVLWPLLVVSTLYLWRRHGLRGRIAVFLFVPLASAALFFIFVYGLYGTLSPFAVYEGIMSPERSIALKEAIIGYPLWTRTDTFFDYFLDQRDGLLLYSPIYVFALAGLIEAFRKSRRELLMLLFIGLPFILNYAFFTHRQGHCPQGRVLTPVIWIGAILLGYFLAFGRAGIFRRLFGCAAVAGLVSAAILLFHPSFLYQPTTHEFTERAGEFFVYLSNIRGFVPSVLPSFLKVENTDYLPNYFWIAGVLVFLVLSALSKGAAGGSARHSPRPISVWIGLGAAFFLWVLYPRTVLYQAQTVNYASQRTLGLYLFPLGRNVVAKNEGELYLHAERTYQAVFASRKRLQTIKLVFGSEKGEEDVSVKFFDLPLYEGRTVREKKEFVFTPAVALPFRHLYLYDVEFRFRKKSSENLKVDPYLLQIIPLK
jgi:hypothetical protein